MIHLRLFESLRRRYQETIQCESNYLDADLFWWILMTRNRGNDVICKLIVISFDTIQLRYLRGALRSSVRSPACYELELNEWRSCMNGAAMNVSRKCKPRFSTLVNNTAARASARVVLEPCCSKEQNYLLLIVHQNVLEQNYCAVPFTQVKGYRFHLLL